MITDNMADILAAGGVSYKPTGKPEVQILCPFHDDHKPSCWVNLDKGVYHCKACNAQGGRLDMAKRLGVKDDASTPQNRKRPNRHRRWRS